MPDLPHHEGVLLIWEAPACISLPVRMGGSLGHLRSLYCQPFVLKKREQKLHRTFVFHLNYK